MPLVAAITPNWKKRRTVRYRDANGKSHNCVIAAAPSSGVVSLRISETHQNLTSIALATTSHTTGAYHNRTA